MQVLTLINLAFKSRCIPPAVAALARLRHGLHHDVAANSPKVTKRFQGIVVMSNRNGCIVGYFSLQDADYLFSGPRRDNRACGTYMRSDRARRKLVQCPARCGLLSLMRC